MVKLSVVIVNYNVCYFLEQTLLSVRRAVEKLAQPVEVFVVDNNSVDGSVAMVQARFPEVQLIANRDNPGFSKANNQALRRATGQYRLLLNPDTVVEEDTFRACCDFMDAHPDCGGLGVKMLDGQGQFLPESKRALPTPEVAFYKMFGLARLMPKSRTFGRYHLGYLSPEDTHEVEVLSGAFMMLRQTALNQIGLLDEDYFMYGEDIDLSHRLRQGGWKNYYFPGTRIIHYKGESTKRTSVNYVFVFYRAMVIFARKHFAPGRAGLFSLLINAAIWLRAGAAVLERLAVRVAPLLLDAGLIWAGMYVLKSYWENNHKFVPGDYPPQYMTVAVPAYILVWLTSAYLSGAYDPPVKTSRVVRGVFLGTLLISAASNFLDAWRFSKALIILGGAWAVAAIVGRHLLAHFIKYRDLRLSEHRQKTIAIVGSGPESRRVRHLLEAAGVQARVIGHVSVAPKPADTLVPPAAIPLPVPPPKSRWASCGSWPISSASTRSMN
ncbi:glycosyltransferase family 2 protein [Hymenobacter humi]|uniref:Glycosyltransferase family 2 protein n=1 Tax=Hymenobacter humi TaxID=1411620 RepID=A0ABW2U7A6_9BACT